MLRVYSKDYLLTYSHLKLLGFSDNDSNNTMHRLVRLGIAPTNVKILHTTRKNTGDRNATSLEIKWVNGVNFNKAFEKVGQKILTKPTQDRYDWKKIHKVLESINKHLKEEKIIKVVEHERNIAYYEIQR